MSQPKTNFWKPGTSKPPQVAGNQLGKQQKPIAAAVKSDSKPTLSKGVLGMKFMKKKDQEELDKVSEKANAESAAPRPQQVVQHDLQQLPGRRSFNGCNKAVERYYESKMEDLKYNWKKAASSSSSTSATDEEILKRCENLIGLPRGPNQGLRPPPKPHTNEEVQYSSKNKVYKREISAEDANPSKKHRKS